MGDQANVIEGLRKLADLLESQPGLPVPWSIPVDVFSREGTSLTPKQAVRMIGGADKKIVGGFFELSKSFGPVSYRINFARDAVCTKRVIGTEEVPEKVIAAYTKEIVEWDCPEVMVLGEGV